MQFVKREPEPERKPDNPAARGDRIHNHCEDYVRGKAPEQPGEASKHFGLKIDKLRELYREGFVLLEQQWTYNEFWQVTEDPKPWLRIKADVFVNFVEDGIVIDYKTGRKFGNEPKHVQQTQLYAIGAFLRYPELAKVTTELWYLDQNDITSITYTRDQAMQFVGRFDKRVERMMEDRTYRPRPNKETCKYCPYSPRGTGACPVGV